MITSHSNPKVKQVRALRQRKERDATGLFVVEGIRPVGEAAAANAAIEFVCYAPDRLVSGFARQLVEEQSARGVPCYPLAADVFDSIADKENPPGLLAVIRQPHLTLDTLAPDTSAWCVALASPQDPGNVGAILRTLDAVGAGPLLLLEASVDAYHPSAVRASLGALFWHPVVRASFTEFARWAQAGGYHIYGTAETGAADYRAVDYQRPMVLLMGSEREGLSAEQEAACEKVVRLPMVGRVTSLNLAVAAGVLLYAMKRL